MVKMRNEIIEMIYFYYSGGKCSICGEAYDAKPRLLGRGDAMYLGKIVRTYTEDSIIPVTVVVCQDFLSQNSIHNFFFPI
mgnify:CR=1 FL=1